MTEPYKLRVFVFFNFLAGEGQAAFLLGASQTHKIRSKNRPRAYLKCCFKQKT